jgi:hypothetical protein
MRGSSRSLCTNSCSIYTRELLRSANARNFIARAIMALSDSAAAAKSHHFYERTSRELKKRTEQRRKKKSRGENLINVIQIT